MVDLNLSFGSAHGYGRPLWQLIHAIMVVTKPLHFHVIKVLKFFLFSLCIGTGVASSAWSQPSNEFEPTGCDLKASDPLDPDRIARGLPDEQMVPTVAITVCEQALAQDPENPRLRYQLGRALWLASREEDAFLQFMLSAEKGYGPAMAGLGEAFSSGKGLPTGLSVDFETALLFYRKAAQSGFTPAEEEVIALNDIVKKTKFSADLFQNPKFAKVLYEHDHSLLNKSEIISFISYLKAFMNELDTEQFYDHYKECKPLLHFYGIWISDIAGLNQVIGLVQGLTQSRDFQTGVMNFMNQIYTINQARDQGVRDASVMAANFNGCNSEVSQRMVSSLMQSGPLAAGLIPRIQSALKMIDPNFGYDLNALIKQ